MKSRIILSFIFSLCFISACSQKEVELENEEVGLYESYFGDRTEDWEYKLTLVELPKGEKHKEEITLRMRYLKDIDEEFEFYYEINYGDHMFMTTEVFDSPILTRDNIEITETMYDKGMIEGACFGQLTFKITWEDVEGKTQEVNHSLNNSENPRCNHFVP